MVNSEEFSARLQLIMEKHDLNASSFAEKINVGRSTISHILSGRNKPSLDFVLAVLKTFKDVDLYWLLNGRGTFPKNNGTENQIQPTTSPVEKKEAPLSHDVSSSKITASTDAVITENEISNNYNKGKKVTKVILIYEDGTFENFIP